MKHFLFQMLHGKVHSTDYIVGRTGEKTFCKNFAKVFLFVGASQNVLLGY